MSMPRKKYLIVTDAVPGREISGRDILRISIRKFVDVCPDIRVLVILPAGRVGQWMDYCSVNNFNIPQSVVTAAFTPYHSIRKALERIPDDAVVAVHDGRRPLVSTRLIRDMFDRMDEGARALVPVVTANEGTMTLSEDMLIPVSASCLSQTPQMFLSEDLKAAYRQAYDLRFVDPASVAAGINIPLTPVEGERYNIRIDTEEDLAAARALWRLLTDANN